MEKEKVKIEKLSSRAMNYLKFLIYGRSGTGKTTLASTSPKPILLIDVNEKGTASILNVPDIYVSYITEWDEFETLYLHLKEKESANKYKTVIIDTITSLQDLAIKKVSGEPTTPLTQREWGIVSNMLKTWLLAYRDLPFNVGFIAQDRIIASEEEADEGVISPDWGPRVMPSVASIACASVDLIGYTFIREKEVKDENKKTKISYQYCLRIGPHQRITTKVRKDITKGGEIPQIIVNPKIDYLYNLIFGEGKNETNKS